MADIELVIKIPNKVYKAICDKNALGCDIGDIKNIIRNGTPLPKGHGRLIDADKVISDGIDKGFCDWYDELKYADTIIEADKGETE